MNSFDDLPTIQVFPCGTASDAELEADRDAKHSVEVAEWLARLARSDRDGECGCLGECFGYCGLSEVFG